MPKTQLPPKERKRKSPACLKCRTGGRGEEQAQLCPGRASRGACKFFGDDAAASAAAASAAAPAAL